MMTPFANSRRPRSRGLSSIAACLALSWLTQCGDSSSGGESMGGAAGAGGAPRVHGGAAGSSAGESHGGVPSEAGSGGSAGASAGEGNSGARAGTAAGGQPHGGADTAGEIGSGGVPNTAGAAGTSGSSAGGAAGGDGGAPNSGRPDFILGADISSVDEAVDLGATFVDTDGQQKTMLALLAAHGFNYVRLRTFVDPMNLYGYANPTGDAAYLRAEPYCDRDHTSEFGKQLKAAGMKLLLDIHYSDNWADPGKQIIPERWRDATTIDDLAERVGAYTEDVVTNLIDAGAAPDIVQLGNEITPGMLIHVPASNPNPDQWGNMNKLTNPINGSSANWSNLGTLLKKAVAGVHAADPNIRIMLHIENTANTGGVLDWVGAARNQGVAFDILGLSCYPNWQGAPSVWENTFRTAARYFPDLQFIIAEYGPEARRANEIMRDLPNRSGLGTFYWEPTQSGAWGNGLFSRNANTYTALDEINAFDAIHADFGIAPSP